MFLILFSKSGENYILWTVATSKWSLWVVLQLGKCCNTESPHSNLTSYHENCKDIVQPWLQTVTKFFQSRRISDFCSNTVFDHSHSFLLLTQTRRSVSYALSERNRELNGGHKVVFHLELLSVYREDFGILPLTL